MSTAPQTTDAQLADGTILRFQGQLSPDEVRQKVAAYRANKAGTVQQAKSPIDEALSGSVLSPEELKDRVSGGAIGSFASRAGDIIKGAAETFDPRDQLSALSKGDILGFLKAQPGYKMASGLVQSEKQAAPQVAQQFKDAQNIKGDAVLKALQYARAGTTALSMADPFATPGVTNINKMEAEGKKPSEVAGAGAADIASLYTGEKAPAAAETTGIALRPGLTESAHRMLSDAATKTKQLVGQGGKVHNAVSQHFEQLANDVAAADYAKTAADGKKIDTSGLWDKVMQHADDYTAGKTTPNFNAVADSIQKRPVEMTFKELHDLKKEVGSRWSKATAGTRDEAAASGALKDINDLLDQRAQDVGRGKQWDAAKTIWSTLKEYQGDGALNKLLNPVVDPVAPGAVSEGGKQFFDTLRDPATQPKLKEINKALEPYGMPRDYFTDLAKSHAPLHNMVSGTAAGGGMFGRTKAALRAVKENPAVGIPAVAAGTTIGSAVGGPIGGTLGAIGALKGVERLSAASAIRKLGGLPEKVNPMAEASQVKPVGTGEKPTPPAAAPEAKQRPMSPKPAPVPTVNEQELMSALTNQGYPAKTARSMAQAAIQDNPHDFNAALKQALSGKSVSGAKSDAIAAAKPESGTYVRPSSVTPQKIADQVQAAKAGKTDTRAETHKAAKKEIETAVTSKDIAAGDTADFAQAKKELPNASISEQLKRAQEIKTARLKKK